MSAEKMFALQTVKLELITECASLGANVKELQVEVSGMKAIVGAAKKELVDKENAWIAEKADLVAKLNEVGLQLGRCQAEALWSFEEGYGKCYGCFFGASIGVESHSFSCYLADLQAKIENGGTCSFNQPGADIV